MAASGAKDLPALGDAVGRLIEKPLNSNGFFVESVRVSPAGQRLVIRVTLDATQIQAPPLSLDQVAQASTHISEILDDDAAFNGLIGTTAYVLECSTPGVGRPLTQLRHWQRALGRLVRVELTDGGTMTSRLSAVDAQLGLTLSDPMATLEWDQVRQGRVQVEFRKDSADEEQPPTDETLTGAGRSRVEEGA